MSDSTKSKLETLPNEIFLEIFQYVDARDLRNFTGLNKRIDSIIDDVKINLDINDDKEADGFFSVFSPTQVYRLEVSNACYLLDLNTMQNIRSLIYTFIPYFRGQPLTQLIGQLQLPALERLSVRQVSGFMTTDIIDSVAANRQYPSLISLSIDGDYNAVDHFCEKDPWINTTLRHLSIVKIRDSCLRWLLRIFPNLIRLEVTMSGSLFSPRNSFVPNFSLKHIRISVNDPLSDLEYLLKLAPNLKRLRIRGNIGSKLVIDCFQRIAEMFIRMGPHLVQFDCELYFCTDDQHDDAFNIQRIHPLFKRIRRLVGPYKNRCYATDIGTYPDGNEYQVPSSYRTTSYSPTFYHGYDDDDDDPFQYNDDDRRSEEEYYEHRDMYWDAESDDWCPLP